MLHPERLSECRVGLEMDVWDIDNISLDWLRQVSYVSSRFRQELGGRIWKRTQILVRGRNEYAQLVPFLQDRPAIWTGIKLLKITIDPQFLAMKGGFAHFCEFISKHLQLEYLEVSLLCFTKEIDGLLNGSSSELLAIKGIPISKDFQLLLDVVLDLNDYLENFRSVPSLLDVKDEVTKKYTPVLRELLLPDNLRNSDPTNQVELYLKSRSDPQQSPSAAVDEP